MPQIVLQMKPETKKHIVYCLSEMFRESKPTGTEKEMQNLLEFLWELQVGIMDLTKC